MGIEWVHTRHAEGIRPIRACPLCADFFWLQGAHFGPTFHLPSPTWPIGNGLRTRPAGPMARRLTTNQEIAGSTPASVNFWVLCPQKLYFCIVEVCGWRTMYFHVEIFGTRGCLCWHHFAEIDLPFLAFVVQEHEYIREGCYNNQAFFYFNPSGMD
jgi:hypothetical protein